MYYFPYFIVFFLIYLCSFFVSDFNTIKTNRNIYFGYLFLLFFLVLFFGCRGFIYTDWINYAKIFDQFPKSFHSFISKYFLKFFSYKTKYKEYIKSIIDFEFLSKLNSISIPLNIIKNKKNRAKFLI